MYRKVLPEVLVPTKLVMSVDDRGQYFRNRSKNSYYLLPGYVNQRETNLPDFSRDTNKEELKIKNDIIFQRLCSFQNSCVLYNVYFDFRFSSSTMFTNKATSLLGDGLYRTILTLRQVPLSNENVEIAVRTFS